MPKPQAGSLIDQQSGRSELIQRGFSIGEQARVDSQAHQRGRLECLPSRIAEPSGPRQDRITRR